ncbi:MAG: hypothetical protein NWE89_00775 [Candidatus Bathyarchaeota archaeon]|nr:hypothetical protein [Candidatus Bathyarchaeota archaeon]
MKEGFCERKFYDIYVKPFGPKPDDVYVECNEKIWKLERDIEVVGVLITISTWDKVPVKVGVCLNGKGVDAGADDSNDVLACLTTPATGGGSSSIYAQVNAKVTKENKINIYVWAHSMDIHPLDFHTQVIIYYRNLKRD